MNLPRIQLAAVLRSHFQRNMYPPPDPAADFSDPPFEGRAIPREIREFKQYAHPATRLLVYIAGPFSDGLFVVHHPDEYDRWGRRWLAQALRLQVEATP